MATPQQTTQQPQPTPAPAAAAPQPAPQPGQNPPHSSASLYAGNLAADVTEAILFELFNSVGPVASIRVCRDTVTRRSLGYGYVNFHHERDAERSLDALNYHVVKGKPIRIMWSQRDPALRKSGVGNIFIKNLDKTIDNKSLHDTFSAFGDILSCKVVVDEKGENRGYGFVHYESAESAQTAIDKVNGMLLNGKKVFVGRHVPRKERDSKAQELKKNFTNVFVKNLDENVTDAELRNMFGKFGEIVSAVVMKNKEGKSKNFGFVNFREHSAAAAACDSEEFKEKKIYVGRAQKKAERQAELAQKFDAIKAEKQNKYQGVNLYVKNLDDSVDDERLRTEFAQFGTISSAKIARDEKKNSKGFGFVCYTSPDEATKAVTAMNGHVLESKPIFVALAQRKEQRRLLLEQQYQARAASRSLQQQNMGVLGGMAYQGGPMFYSQPPMQRPGGFVYQSNMQRAQPIPRGWNQPQPQGQANFRPYPQPAYVQGQQGQQLDQGYQARGPRGSRQGQEPRQNQQGQPAPQVRNMPAQGQQQRMAGGVPTGQARPAGAQTRTQPAQKAGQQPRRPDAPAEQPLTAAVLASMPPDAQKQMLGERIFVQVQQHHPDLAGKITGMLLEMDNTELLSLLDAREKLDAKVDEALAVLKAHNEKEAKE